MPMGATNTKHAYLVIYQGRKHLKYIINCTKVKMESRIGHHALLFLILILKN
jgi:hypothetical protein